MVNATQRGMRIAVLWVVVAVAAASSVLLYLVVPGALAEMLAGQIEGDTLDDTVGFLLAIVVLIPLVMASATLLLASDQVSGYANLIAGTLLGLATAFAVGSHLLAGELNGHILLGVLGSVLAFVIAGLSATSLSRPTVTHPAGRAEPAVGQRGDDR